MQIQLFETSQKCGFFSEMKISNKIVKKYKYKE
jgi:hypothetical protein